MQTCTGSFISLRIGAGSTETGNNGAAGGKAEMEPRSNSEPEISGKRVD
jgi:hypothetical protein